MPPMHRRRPSSRAMRDFHPESDRHQPFERHADPHAHGPRNEGHGERRDNPRRDEAPWHGNPGREDGRRPRDDFRGA